MQSICARLLPLLSLFLMGDGMGVVGQEATDFSRSLLYYVALSGIRSSCWWPEALRL